MDDNAPFPLSESTEGMEECPILVSYMEKCSIGIPEKVYGSHRNEAKPFIT